MQDPPKPQQKGGFGGNKLVSEEENRPLVKRVDSGLGKNAAAAAAEAASNSNANVFKMDEI